MKKKIALAVLTASFYVAFPIVAQSSNGNNGNHGTGGNHGEGNNGNHNGHGNNSNHSGHDDDGNSAGHRQDRPHGFGDHDNLVLASPAITASVASAVTSVAAALRSTSLTTPSGTPIPSSAQTRAYTVLSGNVVQPGYAEMAAVLSTAGPKATAIVPGLMQSFGALRGDASRLPSTIAQYNSFTKAASSEFISNPPPEFLALHAALARLIAASAAEK